MTFVKLKYIYKSRNRFTIAKMQNKIIDYLLLIFLFLFTKFHLVSVSILNVTEVGILLPNHMRVVHEACCGARAQARA